jgi:acetyltransferase-like isoleucine patch superfamily enzyme
LDVKAILLIGTRAADMDGTSGLSGGAPLSTVDVLGRSLVLRIVDRLARYGVNTVYVVGDVERLKTAAEVPSQVQFVAAGETGLWRECEAVFGTAVQNGAETLLVQRVGPYLELDYDDLIAFHLDRRNRVTPVRGEYGDALDVFCVSASRRNDAAYLFRHQLQESRSPSGPYTYIGYRNAMLSGADLRQLTIDAFEEKIEVHPTGRQIRPGVWLGEGARIERGARVLAPAFIGAHAVVRPAAVVTRFSAVEHHAEVDCGTVIENANVLPCTYIGAALDVAHAVVGNQRLLNLPRNVEIEIADPKLVRTLSEHAPVRFLSALAALGPKRLLQRILPGLRPPQPASLPAAIQAPSAALKSPAALQAVAQPGESEFPGNLMVARRYGNE